MKKKLISFVKYNKVVLKLYTVFGNIFVSFLKLVIPTKPNRILFVSFGGQKYDDSPKALYDTLIQNDSFSNADVYWGFNYPSKYEIPFGKKVKVDTLKYYIIAISSHIWVTNSSVERGLNLSTKRTIEFNTWHGTPIKKMGSDILNGKTSNFKIKKGIHYYCSQSEYDQSIFSGLFNCEKDNIFVCDLPRNDFLADTKRWEIDSIKRKLGLPLNKKIILYAPTFREYDRNSMNACFIRPPISLNKWEKVLGEKYILLFRAHYEVIDVLGIVDNDFIKNVSQYPSLNELLVISDLLISDYSSIYFDFSILERPMLNFSYDLDKYSQFRGLYDAFNDLPCKICVNEDDLLKEICELNYSVCCKKTGEFKMKYAPNAGNACSFLIKKIKSVLE